ncbi:non-ribosomal peptide synthetase [Microbacterium marinilacus]|uniref:Amino acid adenylation domain-containing protein n=1 Tax=Microbacterium marinilacus TaxID=415209 RepID=A0ABP7BKU8_9MICO|nr:amino acid adenylation domain-containing protein [Microbacterium marinilacus]
MDREVYPVVRHSDSRGATFALASGSDGSEVRLCPEGPNTVRVEVAVPNGDVWQHSKAAVAEMIGELLAAALTHPERAMEDAEAMSAQTRTQVLGPLAGTAVEHGTYRGVVERIVTAAGTSPTSVAVHAADTTLTYAQLLSAAESLASSLANTVPSRGTLLPVLVADGAALPVAWLATMMAGAAYVPVDPRWPESRVAEVLDRLDAPVVLTSNTQDVPAAHRERALVVDLAGDSPADTEDIRFPAADDVVYGVFTSGTTGAPQCAVNLHGGLANRLSFMDGWFAASDGVDVVLQTTRHVFDSAFWQLFWPLTRGGATVVPPVTENLDLASLLDLIETHGVTVVDFVPAVLGALLRLIERRPAMTERLRSLRHVIIGGDRIDPRDAHRLREMLPGLRVSNAYGPTEASIGMIFHDVTEDDGEEIPLGRPIDNCVAVVVDVDGRPLPPGATGEILIGGACVGAGYHRAPERTASRFVTPAWRVVLDDGTTVTRMYRTGDLGRIDTAGRFRFSGRVDHQIKLDGVRIEPAEIEAVALGHVGVRQAVALVSEEEGARELLIFVAGDVKSDKVLALLRRQLPKGSVPRRCLVVDELPLTAAGKTDRVALTRLAVQQPTHGGVEKSDPILAALRRSLRMPFLAADDDVFAAGATSLQVVGAALALEDECGAHVGVRDMVDHPTAEQLRTLIHRRRSERSAEPDVTALVEADLRAYAGASKRRPSPHRARHNVGTLLLTGATGFVGARVLHQLLLDTDLHVVCMARGADASDAERRVRDALSGQQLAAPGFAERVTTIPGDLARPALGLEPSRWGWLIEESDVILHVGAMVNLAYDYRMHREPNVRGTAELIRLAVEAGGIPLHYVSTLGALHDHALLTGEVIHEDVDIAEVTPPTGGYSLSKWAAERVLAAAADDLTVTVLRLGEVMPAADNSVPNRTALTSLLINAFRRLGMVPDADIRSDDSPLDTVARSIVAAVQDPEAWGHALHLFRPQSIRFDEAAGETIKRVSCVEFIAALRRAGAAGDAELGMLHDVISLRGAVDHEDEARAVLEGLLQDNPRRFSRYRADLLERRWGIQYAPGAERAPIARGAQVVGAVPAGI